LTLNGQTRGSGPDDLVVGSADRLGFGSFKCVVKFIVNEIFRSVVVVVVDFELNSTIPLGRWWSNIVKFLFLRCQCTYCVRFGPWNEIVVRKKSIIRLVEIIYRSPTRICNIDFIKIKFIVHAKLAADIADIKMVQTVAMSTRAVAMRQVRLVARCTHAVAKAGVRIPLGHHVGKVLTEQIGTGIVDFFVRVIVPVQKRIVSVTMTVVIRSHVIRTVNYSVITVNYSVITVHIWHI